VDKQVVGADQARFPGHTTRGRLSLHAGWLAHQKVLVDVRFPANIEHMLDLWRGCQALGQLHTDRHLALDRGKAEVRQVPEGEVLVEGKGMRS
jgi:hypothetical protein